MTFQYTGGFVGISNVPSSDLSLDLLLKGSIPRNGGRDICLQYSYHPCMFFLTYMNGPWMVRGMYII